MIENKEVLRKYKELWDGIKNEIETINGGKIGEYDKDFIKIKFDFDDYLLLNKQLQYSKMTIVFESVFEDEVKLYPQFCLDECLNELRVQEALVASEVKTLEYDRIDISEGIYTNKTKASKECDICHYCYFKGFGFKYELNLCNGSRDLMKKAISLNCVAIVYIKKNVSRIHLWYMSNNNATNIMNFYNLVNKKTVLNFFYCI